MLATGFETDFFENADTTAAVLEGSGSSSGSSGSSSEGIVGKEWRLLYYIVVVIQILFIYLYVSVRNRWR